MSPTARFVRAIAFAAHKHRDQRRKDAGASPYINHPIGLTSVLSVEAGIDDPDVLSAAVLHDTLEDTETTYDELAEAFGVVVAGIVVEVTDDKTLDKRTRKQLQIDHAPSLSREAALVKLADKICNLRDVAACAPPSWSLARRQEYFDWAKRVIDGVRGMHPGLEAMFDHEYARRPTE